MPETALQPLYAYCLQPPQDVIQSVFALAREKEKLVSTGMPVVAKMFVHIDAIYEVLLNYSTTDPLSLIDLAAVSWIETIVIRQFIIHPEDVANRDRLAVQLRFVAAAIGALPRVTPYTVGELDSIAAGTANFYDALTLVLTARLVAGEPEPNEFIPFFCNQLLLHTASEEKYTWEEGFVLAAIIRSMWMQFLSLNDSQQILLVQNYLYLGIAVGVPISAVLDYIINAGLSPAAAEEANSLYLVTMENSKEVVPMKANGALGRALATIIKSFITLHGKEFDMEKSVNDFCAQMYQAAPNAIILSHWLQDVLKVYVHIYNGDWLPAEIKNAAQ